MPDAGLIWYGKLHKDRSADEGALLRVHPYLCILLLSRLGHRTSPISPCGHEGTRAEDAYVTHSFLVSQTPTEAPSQAQYAQHHQQTRHQEDTAAKAMEAATELRANGQGREAVKAHLATMNVSETAAEYLINQADLFAGMMGRPHPRDIDPSIRGQIDETGPMMISESLVVQKNAAASPLPASKDEALARAKSMAEQGADTDTITQFLVKSGAPSDEAAELAHRFITTNLDGTSKKNKKKRGLFRRS